MVNQPPEQPQYEYDWQNPDRKSFDFGRTFTRTIDIIRRDGLKMFWMSLILIGLPMAVISAWPMFSNFSGLDMTDPNATLGMYTGAAIVVIIVGALMFFVASLWLQPALIQMAFGSIKNENMTIGGTLKSSARYILPYLGLSIIYIIAVMIGLILLIIPALFIGLGWLLAYQIMILEGERVTDSLGRAWELSKGSKRWLLLLAIVFAVIGAVIGAVISIPIYLVENPTLAMLEGASTGYWILNAVLSALSQVIGTVLGAAWTTSAYAELRQVKEGLDLKNQADIFS